MTKIKISIIPTLSFVFSLGASFIPGLNIPHWAWFPVTIFVSALCLAFIMARKCRLAEEINLTVFLDPESEDFITPTTTENGRQITFVRALVSVSVPSYVGAHLTSIKRKSNNTWVQTEYNESLNLTWANSGRIHENLSPEARKFLDILSINDVGRVRLATENMPNRYVGILNQDGEYKLECSVNDFKSPPVLFSIAIEKIGTSLRNISCEIINKDGVH